VPYLNEVDELKLNAGLFRILCNLWPPLFFPGIKATYVSPDYRHIKVTLKLRWYSRNYVGVQYGGSLMSMTDPWYMLMLLNNLGRDYFIWDKHAEIDYVSPGKTHVHAEFHLTQELLDEIKEKTAGGEKYLPTFMVEIRDNDGTLIARVKRTLYIKLKPRARSAG
jgi:hypothetical protein